MRFAVKRFFHIFYCDEKSIKSALDTTKPLIRRTATQHAPARTHCSMLCGSSDVTQSHMSQAKHLHTTVITREIDDVLNRKRFRSRPLLIASFLSKRCKRCKREAHRSRSVLVQHCHSQKVCTWPCDILLYKFVRYRCATKVFGRRPVVCCYACSCLSLCTQYIIIANGSGAESSSQASSVSGVLYQVSKRDALASSSYYVA